MPNQTQYTPPDDEGSLLLNDKDALRKKAAQGYANMQGIADKQTNALQAQQTALNTGFDQAETAGANDIRRQAALGFASGSAAAGHNGRAGYGAALQTGQDSGFNQGQMHAHIAGQRSAANIGLAKDIGQSQLESAQIGQQGLESIGKMGTTAEGHQQKQFAYDQQIAAIKQANKGFFNDDENNAAAQINALAQYETDPALKAYLNQQASLAISQDF